jgi:hypothetical protein
LCIGTPIITRFWSAIDLFLIRSFAPHDDLDREVEQFIRICVANHLVATPHFMQVVVVFYSDPTADASKLIL